MGPDRPLRRRRRLAAVQDVARGQGNVVTRRHLYALGYTRGEVRAEIRAGRWRRRGDMCVQVGDPDCTTAWWQALLEIGPTAVLDGVTALLAAGLRTVEADAIHVAAPKSSRPRPCRGVRIHETRRLRAEDIDRTGIPRTRPATAAVHAALWARSDAEAALLIIAPFQQRLMTAAELADAVGQIKRHRRRQLLQGLLRDVCEGIEALGEREFAAACRRRGYPKPTHQVARRLPTGRVVYDSVWVEFSTKAEIDGVQHLDAAAATRDALKQNAASVTGWRVVRIPNFAFRVNPEPFLDQLGDALRAGGWKPALRPSKRAS